MSSAISMTEVLLLLCTDTITMTTTKMTTMMPRKAAIAPITAGKGNWAVFSGEAAVVPIYRN
jgi:hypothetical protein